MTKQDLILSTFSGTDLFGLGFEENGFCVVSGGDIILGNHHDIRHKHYPSGIFSGLIGGSPCQKFSIANRKDRDIEKGMELVNEFIRVVQETNVDWFILENVPTIPDITVEGYTMQVFYLDAKHCTPLGFPVQSRNRKFQFGSKQGLQLIIERDYTERAIEPCLIASEHGRENQRSFLEACQLQGLEHELDLPFIKEYAKFKVVGNAVNLWVSRKIAKAIRLAIERYQSRAQTPKLCICGCGEIITTKGEYFKSTCRWREHNRRNAVCVPGLCET
jgi:DNA (cytosine-5)-methyltransferase 1